jgi:predicted PhzF superfamily epimerase YddE/YHI9
MRSVVVFGCSRASAPHKANVSASDRPSASAGRSPGPAFATMSGVSELHVLNVFTDERGRHGNPLGVFAAAAAIAPHRRQAVAKRLGYSETVFVDDPPRGALRIYTPATELPFAGHPLVGAAWLLGLSDPSLAVLRPPAGDVALRREGDLTWIRARPDQAPAWDLVQLDSVAELLACTGAPGGGGHVYAWAWEDEQAGRVRARAFAPDYGVPEDPATGSAALRLGDLLGRPLFVVQGAGSEILVRPEGDGTFEVGGRVVLDERRDFQD